MQTIRRIRPLALLAATTLMTAGVARAQTTAPFNAVTESRKVIDALGEGKFADVEALYAPEMAQALPAGQLAMAWAQLGAQVGKLKELGEPKTEQRDGVTLVTFPATYDGAKLNLLVAWNADRKLAGLLAQPGG